MTVLYLCYDGLMEQLGQSQVLQYLLRLSSSHRIVLVTYEKSGDWADVARREALRTEVNHHGILWVPLRYHKRLSVLATSYDLAVGLAACLYLVPRHRVQIVHARSYVMSVLAILLKRVYGIRYIFDMRGFWVDARAEMGIWRRTSMIYRLAKRLERRFLLDADVIVALSRKAVDAMRTWPYLQGKTSRFEAITTCTNLDLFKPLPESGTQSRAARPFVLGYVGNAGPGYLFDRALECFLELRRRRPDALLRIVNKRDHSFIRERLKELAVPEDAVELRSAEHREVPSEMARMDAGIVFMRQDPSRIADQPTRMGEFLGCGVPCLGTSGIGDVEKILEGGGCGIALRDFTSASIETAIERLLSMASDASVKKRCVEAARRHCSLSDGVGAYDRIYRELGEGVA